MKWILRFLVAFLFLECLVVFVVVRSAHAEDCNPTEPIFSDNFEAH